MLVRAEDPYRLVKIVVTGSQRYEPADLMRATGLAENSRVTRQDLEASGKRLLDSGAFASVQYTYKPAAGVRAVEADFQVKDAEKFLPAELENFVWWSDQELEDAVHQAVPLYRGQLPLSGTLPDDVAGALTKLLATKGVAGSVEHHLFAEMGELPSAFRYKITGGVPKIKGVQFTDATHLPADALARCADALKNHDYLRSDLKKILERTLAQSYSERGYLKFKIVDVRPTVSDSKDLSVNITVSEGDQYRLAGFAWSGNTAVPGDQLSKLVTIKPGEPVNFPRLESNLAAVRKMLRKFGREAAVIKPVATFAGNNVTYDFQVAEGDVYRMGNLEIEGLDPEPTAKVRSLWKLAPGSAYDNTYVTYFITHLVMKLPGHTFTCEYVEQPDDSQKTVNVHLLFKTE
jgi:outer membrane protein insertion porin family